MHKYDTNSPSVNTHSHRLVGVAKSVVSQPTACIHVIYCREGTGLIYALGPQTIVYLNTFQCANSVNLTERKNVSSRQAPDMLKMSLAQLMTCV